MREKNEKDHSAGHGWHWGAKCDEPAKPETGPMRNAESPSGVQELGSSGLALAIHDIIELRDAARNYESSRVPDDLRILWRGKAIAYETVLGRLSRVGSGNQATQAERALERAGAKRNKTDAQICPVSPPEDP